MILDIWKFIYLHCGTGLNFFQILFTTTRLSSVFSCEDLLISSLHRSANIWTFIYLNHHSNDNWRCGPRRASVWKGGRLPSWFSTVVCQGWCSRGLLETSKLGIFEANCSLASVALHGEDWVCSELKWNYSMCAWILRWICGRPVILSLDFSLLGSGVRKWSVQPWAFLMYVENLEMNNSLKWALFIKVSGQITSNTLWK